MYLKIVFALLFCLQETITIARDSDEDSAVMIRSDSATQILSAKIARNITPENFHAESSLELFSQLKEAIATGNYYNSNLVASYITLMKLALSYHDANPNKRITYLEYENHPFILVVKEILSRMKTGEDIRGYRFKWQKQRPYSAFLFLTYASKIGVVDSPSLFPEYLGHSLIRWSDAAGDFLEEDLKKTERCIEDEQVTSLFNSLVRMRIQPTKKLYNGLRDFMIAKYMKENIDIDTTISIMKKWLWIADRYPNKLLLAALPILNKAFREQLKDGPPEPKRLNNLAQMTYKLALHTPNNLHSTVPEKFFDLLTNQKTFLTDQTKNSLYQLYLRLTVLNSKDLDISQETYDLIQKYALKLSWLEQERKSGVTWSKKGYNTNTASTSEDYIFENLKNTCESIKCLFKQSHFDSQTLRIYDFMILKNSAKYFLEFNGPFHYYYSAFQRKFYPHASEKNKIKILRKLYPKKFYYIHFYHFIGLRGKALKEKLSTSVQRGFEFHRIPVN